jgi:hypothetical protein
VDAVAGWLGSAVTKTVPKALKLLANWARVNRDSRRLRSYSDQYSAPWIKHVVRETDENVYKKGFIVDVNVQLVGRPAGYRVTKVHQVIDLPE